MGCQVMVVKIETHIRIISGFIGFKLVAARMEHTINKEMEVLEILSPAFDFRSTLKTRFPY
ncbi:hypothetical protein CE143_17565 [Photorhabdus luminescens]|uniref:Uncharacterized protein n=1 Tax=Photorhabdus akhurstii TaxID=171438 RepID=A0ABX8M0V4_9GAMM|nr:hypothetical protein B0X70_17555 [Photorhabdus akhurstii]UJD76599.1 hypothetical protein CE143_17565 [Photorhabdus luminescens]